MEKGCNIFSIIAACFLFVSSSASLLPTSSFLGIHPQEENYFKSKVIKCKDGSKSFTRDRLNDGFCDCVDGTDEPGTSACPGGKFYCRNVGDTPQVLFSSRVNDCICDCCDGSDEYDSGINCPNTCFKDGNTLQKNDDYNFIRTHLVNVDAREASSRVSFEDLIQKLKELKILVVGEVILISCVVAFLLSRQRLWSGRRRRRFR
ncbi:hypothetical protein NE237_032582 [Protea cynaroides]|uniref:Glucosidase II beta subunit N-terminal domain-containing protein n=1 Tax=Protea cynaroides TaxID=273540 RepID=A0A9Q0R387_9MAGN|nr:hypothetical protein NE237_032582 [Protea cynaroides]